MNKFGYYFKKVYLAMAIWQGLGVILNAIMSDWPLFVLLLQGIVMMLVLAIPSLIAAAILARGDSKK